MDHDWLVVIDAPHFYAGVVFRDGMVVRSADIVKYMKGWSLEQVKSYCEKKNWRTLE